MRPRAIPGLAIVLAISAACGDYVRPAESIDADPDVVALSILLIAGEREARMLAVHPHRPHTDTPPRVEALLRGPGWAAEWSETVPVEQCTLADPGRWPGPITCLRATLPEPIRPRIGYGIEGRALPGAFTGSVVVPAEPILLEPGDTLALPPPSGARRIEVAVRYRIGPDVGTLLHEALDAYETADDGSEVAIDLGLLGIVPGSLEGGGADTLSVRYQDRPLRFSLRLLGIGWNYTNFLAYASGFPLPEPWPGFGIDGEGVYGYFAAAAPSRSVHVTVR